MRILIVGGTSTLGIALKNKLAGSHEIITAGRNNCDIIIDLAGQEELSFPNGIDVVIHTAASFGSKTDSEIFNTAQVNVMGTLKVSQAAKNADVKHLVYISSIFSTTQKGSPQYGIYALSKKMAEELVLFYCENHHLPLSIIRPSQIYGIEDGHKKHQPFLYHIVDNAEKGNPISFYGKNDAKRNYIHLDDVVRIITVVVENRIEGAFACTQLNHISYSQIAKAAIDAFESASVISFNEDQPDIADSVFGIDDSLYRRTGVYPEITMEEGMRSIARSRRSNL
jgi:nucleoside-diphosphate-sugar epimerase